MGADHCDLLICRPAPILGSDRAPPRSCRRPTSLDELGGLIVSATRPDLERPLVPTRAGERPAAGARIANARGVPGTLGFLGVSRADHRLLLVSAHHVLFGAGARAGDPVWLLEHDRPPRCIARTLHGLAGVVRHAGEAVFVDCAVAAVDGWEPLARWRTRSDRAAATMPAVADPVTKHGAATGLTEGRVVGIARTERAMSRGRAREVPRQVAVRADVGAFSAPGDSGAALRDARGEIAGLLWGTNERGESLACPIAAVLHLLHIRPVRLAPAPVRATAVRA